MLKYFRNRKTFGWILGAFLLVLVIFAFVAFYIPDFMGPQGPGGISGDVAWVEGEPISAREFIQGYRGQEQVYRNQMGANFSPDLMRQFGLDRAVVDQLVQTKLLALEAERQGLSVSDDELARAIMENPNLQNENGEFIGQTAYLQLIAQNPLLGSATQFEENVRAELLQRRLQELVTDGVFRSDKDLREEFRRRNETAKLEYTMVGSADFKDEVAVSPEEARAYFDSHPDTFAHPVQRKVRFVTLTPQLFTVDVEIRDREIERYYNQNVFRYEATEAVEASHILFKTEEGADEEEVRARAQSVLARARAGEDFSALAMEFSEDTSAAQGGSLGSFSRGDMVPEFEQAAFNLPVESISDLVKTVYGYHIIRVEAHQEPLTQPLEAVRDEIESTLTQEKARDAMEAAVESYAAELRQTGSIDALKSKYNLLVPQETGFFGRNDRVPQLGNSTEATQQAFDLPVNGVSQPIRMTTGYAFLQVLKERPEGPLEFEEIEDRARTEAENERLMELALARARELSAELAESGAASGVELKTTDTFFRGSQLPEAGVSVAVGEQAFELAPGVFSEPLEATNGYAILRVVERSGNSQEQFDERKKEFRRQLLQEARSRAWSTYLSNLRSRYNVQVDWQALRDLTS